MTRSIYEIQEFSQLCDSLPDIIWCMTPDGKIAYLSKSWETITGVAPSKVKEVDNLLELIHPEHKKRFQSQMRLSLRESAKITFDFKLKTKKKSYCWHHCRSYPIATNSAVDMWYGRMFPIDDQMREMESLRRALELRDHFLALAAHEIRSPLTTAFMAVELAKTQAGAGPASNRLEVAMKALRTASAMVDEWVDMSKSLRGAFQLEAGPLDLSAMLRNFVSKKAPQAGLEGVTAHLKCEPGVWGWWDEFRLEQVLSNLFSNAVKYGNGRPVAIELKNCHNEDCALLSVQDFGCGIDPQDHERIFNKFNRVARDKAAQSMGVGLFIVKSLVEAHQGKVWVESSLGKGSTFYVKLPKRSSKIKAAAAKRKATDE